VRAGRANELHFAPTLSKDDRAVVHKAAEAIRLGTLSVGIGTERAIRVLAGGPKGGAGSAGGAAASPRVQHLATLMMQQLRDGTHQRAPTGTTTLRQPTFDELRQLLQTGAPLASPYTHIEPLRLQSERQLQHVYGPLPTLPDLAVGASLAAELRLAFELRRSAVAV